jgi:dienelactone hydrolase
MGTEYRHLGSFSDWVEEARRQRELCPKASPGPETRRKFREVLGFCGGAESPLSVRSERTWGRDGVAGEEVSWSAGFGPRTHAYVLKPAGATDPLPGVLALHDHGGFKFYGKEKIADGPEGDIPKDALPAIARFRGDCYGGRAFANALAREGFIVLIHDTFLWGSRRFPYGDIPEGPRTMAEQAAHSWQPDPVLPHWIRLYNQAAGYHELWIEKYCALLGATMAGVCCREDRIAVNYLRSRSDVQPGHIGCLGLSGGGNRSTMLLATHEGIAAAAVVGLMSTYEGLLDHNVMSHTWMFFPHGWARHGDWPDAAASRAPMPLLVQYDNEDPLFTPQGMRDAHERIASHYRDAGAPGAYTGQFYPGPHKFDLPMQEAAFVWLKGNLQCAVGQGQ